MNRFYIILMCFCSFYSTAIGQSKTIGGSKAESVFFIGESEKQYEKLVSQYSTMLFAVCDNNMEVAFDRWSDLLKDIEAFSVKSNVDIKGVKLWINVFWAKDGKIDHIVFHPKPNSKNINYDVVKNLLVNFITEYQSPMKYDKEFSHYGSAAFPIFSKSYIGNEK